jgi:hypothetical protein
LPETAIVERELRRLHDTQPITFGLAMSDEVEGHGVIVFDRAESFPSN